MKFRVAGGPTGDAGIDVADRRYEVGDEVEMTQKQAEWLLDQGYLAPIGKGGFTAVVEATPEPEPEVVADVDVDEVDGEEF
jgi:hypothetical protein